MEIKKTQRQSIIDTARAHLGNEIPDELLDEICGGRSTTSTESADIMQKVTSANKTMNDEDFQRFFTAVYFYLHYIYSLPEDAPEEFFNYDFYDGKDYKPIHNS